MSDHNMVHVGVRDAKEVLLYSLLGTTTNIKSQIESMQTYAGFVAYH